MKHPIRLTIAALLRDGKPRTARTSSKPCARSTPANASFPRTPWTAICRRSRPWASSASPEGNMLEAGTLTQRYALSEYGKGRVERFL